MVLIERLVQFRIVFQRRPMLYDTVVTTALTIVGKGIGFIVPIFIARWYGATADTDAFFFIYGLILFLVGIFSNAVEFVLVPFLMELRARQQGEQLVGRFIGNLLVGSTAIMTLLVILLLVFLPPLLPLVTRLPDLALAQRLLVEIAPFVLLVTISSVLNGALNAHKVFWMPALSPAVRGGVVLACAWSLRGLVGIHALTYGYVVAEFLRALFSGLVLYWRGHVRIVFSLRRDNTLASFARTTLTFVAGTTVGGLAIVIDKAVASFLSTGSVTLLEYARTLFFVPVTALSAGFIVVSLAHRAEQFYMMDHRDLRRMLVSSLKPLALLCIACGAVGIGLRYLIIQLVYGKGLTPEQILTVSDMLFWYMLTLPPYMFYVYFSQAFLITRSIVPLVRWAGINCMLVAILDVLFGQWMGATGIVMATFVTYIILAGGLYWEMDASKVAVSSKPEIEKI